MDTRRCPRCNKLLRADAQQCSRCSHSFTRTGKVKRASMGRIGNVPRSLASSRPSNPPASPHRAGHYSGLHPEDQPFQSSFMPIQRSPASERRERMLAPEEIPTLVPEQGSAENPAQVETLEIRRPSPAGEPSPIPLPVTQRRTTVARTKTSQEHFTPLPETLPHPVSMPRKAAPSKRQPRIVSFLLIASCLLFLVATSLLVFLLLQKKPAPPPQPVLTATPGLLRMHDTFLLNGRGFQIHGFVTLTRDVNVAILNSQGQPAKLSVDATGAFSVRITITPDWSTGAHTIYAVDSAHVSGSTSISVQQAPAAPPSLQLGSTHIDLGADSPGAVSHKTITLTNAGGGQISWSAKSDAAWLTLSPKSGSFSGSAAATLTADRTDLAPQAYTGHLTFTQQGNSSALQVLNVTMTVNTIPANLALSTTSLAYTGTTAQNPSAQTMTLQNTGGQPLDWSATPATSDGANWLSVSLASGHLAPGTSTALTISSGSTGLAVGSYLGAVDFSYTGGPTQQVNVTLTVNPPPLPVMHVQTQNLSFTTNEGFNPAPQSFTISNTGNGPLDWVIHEDANGLAYVAVSPGAGSVPPGGSIRVTVTPAVVGASGTINAVLTILDSDTGVTIPSQQVKVSIGIANQPVINVSTNTMVFSLDSTITSSTQLLLIKNTGHATLHWSLAETTQPPVAWLSMESGKGTLSGTLAPGETTYVNITCDSSSLSPGQYTATLVVSDTDQGTVAASQTVTVTLTVS